MKRLFRALLTGYLALTAKLVVLRHRPKVIAVSGSTRKTATKESIYERLAPTYSVRRNPRSYNTEIGVPVSILNIQAGESSYLRWVVAMVAALIKVFSVRYPDVLVLEFGVDGPGDMDRLLRVVRPHVAVFTTIEPLSGDSAVSDVQVTEAEQRILLEALPADGIAVINEADPLLKALASEAPCPVVSYQAKGGQASINAAAEAAVRAFEKLQAT